MDPDPAIFITGYGTDLQDANKKPVLRIRDVYPRSRIPDPTFFHPGSRIQIVPIPDPGSRIRIKEFKYFNQKNGF
jgi:hypothetical protein